MLDRSPLSDDTLLAFARDHFSRPATAVTFLPLGYDANAYRLVAGETYLLKVRRWPAFSRELIALALSSATTLMEEHDVS